MRKERATAKFFELVGVLCILNMKFEALSLANLLKAPVVWSLHSVRIVRSQNVPRQLKREKSTGMERLVRTVPVSKCLPSSSWVADLEQRSEFDKMSQIGVSI
jgi:hypothetical protein